MLASELIMKLSAAIENYGDKPIQLICESNSSFDTIEDFFVGYKDWGHDYTFICIEEEGDTLQERSKTISFRI